MCAICVVTVAFELLVVCTIFVVVQYFQYIIIEVLVYLGPRSSCGGLRSTVGPKVTLDPNGGH